jgi:excisionase family DNA binding protein
MLGCSPWTVRKWETQGRLKAVRLGKLVRFEMGTIREFIAAGRTPAKDGRAK